MISLPTGIVVPEYIKSIEFIEENLYYLDSVMSEKLNGESLEDITEKMTDLMAYRPVVNDMYASAKFYLQLERNRKYRETLQQFNSQSNDIREAFEVFKSPSILKDYIDTLVTDFTWLYNKCERTNRGLTHYLDELRSLMSKEKELHKSKAL